MPAQHIQAVVAAETSSRGALTRRTCRDVMQRAQLHSRVGAGRAAGAAVEAVEARDVGQALVID